ncbi:MAG TPA: hypothetical protein VL588_05500 [Bdellovibrionota bacterium]|nr:hypothetical protein [Bdellovibrionota bacterium]
MFTNAVAATFMAFAATGCWSNDTIDSSEVDENALYGHYSATFDAGTAQLRLFAQLTVGGWSGTTVRLGASESITGNGRPLDLHDGDSELLNLIGTYYERVVPVSQPDAQADFVWTRSDGTTYENKSAFPSAVSISAPASGSQSRSADLIVSFTATGSGTGESVTVALQSQGTAAQGQTTYVSHVATGSTIALFTASELSGMPSGPATLTVTHSKSVSAPIGHPQEGGTLDMAYKSAPVQLNLQ